MTACRHPISLSEGGHPAYQRALSLLHSDGVPVLGGGALALAAYAGIRRNTKDLDLFTLERHVPRVLRVLEQAGFRTETPFPHWLAKGHAEDRFVDVIFSSGNGAARVDEEWFKHAVPAQAFGVPLSLCPPEETIWSKAFVMERERYDGADVAHLLLGCGATLDWSRLLRRFGEHWRVLLAHLILFEYVYPAEASQLPGWVMQQLLAGLSVGSGDADRRRVCWGTLLSREQYLPDLASGWGDARLSPVGTMSAEDVANWTDAIARKGA